MLVECGGKRAQDICSVAEAIVKNLNLTGMPVRNVILSALENTTVGSIAGKINRSSRARLWNHRTDGLSAYAAQIAAVIDEQGQHLRSKKTGKEPMMHSRWR